MKFYYNLSMQQYFSEKREKDVLLLNIEDYHHIKNVMRLSNSDIVIVNYNGISYRCKLNEDLKSVTIIDIYKKETESINIIAYIPILQEEKMSFVIEKGTEMGVCEFIPVEFERCKYKIPKDKIDKKLERWRKIAKEASEQSRRLKIPIIKNIVKPSEISRVNGVNILYSLDEENVKQIKEVLNLNTLCDRISLVFGPEGGISKTEEDVIYKNGFTKTSLGKNVLRTETVIIYVCSIINYLKG